MISFLDGKYELRITLRFPVNERGGEYSVHRVFYSLENKVQLKTPTVNVAQSSGKVDIKLLKAIQQCNSPPVMWKSLGTPIKQIKSEQYVDFRKWVIKNKLAVTHDVSHYVVEPSMKVCKNTYKNAIW